MDYPVCVADDFRKCFLLVHMMKINENNPFAQRFTTLWIWEGGKKHLCLAIPGEQREDFCLELSF